MKSYVDAQISGVSGGNATWNQSWADTLYSSIIWNYNQTIISNAYADLLNTSVTNRFTVYNVSAKDWTNYVNTTAGAYTLYLNTTAGMAFYLNGTAGAAFYVNSTAASYARYVNGTMASYAVSKTGGNMTGNLNMTVNNITSVDCIWFNSGGKICSA